MLKISDIQHLQLHWKPLTIAYNNEFAETFQQLHQAVQFLALTGKSVFPPRFDDSHTAFFWDYSANCFATDWIHSVRALRLELDPVDLKMSLVDYKKQILSTINLQNKTKKEVYSQLRQMLSAGGIVVNNFSTEMHYDLPQHEVCTGGKYTLINPKYNHEIELYYSNAFLLLNLIKGKFPETLEIRCWPHHFDITLDTTINSLSNTDKFIRTIGFAPSSILISEPYFYIQLKNRPYAEGDCLPKLKHGKWFKKEWFGMYITVSSLLKQQIASDQTTLLAEFIREGLERVVPL